MTESVAREVNKILLCWTETNTFIVVFQVLFYYPISMTIQILCSKFILDTATCTDCPHRQSSARALVHKKNRREEVCPYKQWVQSCYYEIIIISDIKLIVYRLCYWNLYDKHTVGSGSRTTAGLNTHTHTQIYIYI